MKNDILESSVQSSESSAEGAKVDGLARFGWHLHDCMAGTGDYACTCGFAAALRHQQAAQVASPYPHLEQASLQQHVPTTVSDRTTAQVEAVPVVQYLLEESIEMLSRPTYNALETGFRHSPLTLREERDRALQTCAHVAQSLKQILAASPKPPSP